MPLLDVWRNKQTIRLDRLKNIQSSCIHRLLFAFSFVLIYFISGSATHADTPDKIILSDYNIVQPSAEKFPQKKQSVLKQTQFSRKKRKRKPARQKEIDFTQFVRVNSKGTSKRSARKRGLSALPLSQLSPEKQAKAQTVLRKVSLYRELPTISLDVNHDVYQYFLKNPEIAVAIWRVMGISKFQMWQTDTNSYGADAGDGSKGDIDVLYRSETECMLVCNGVYDSPLLVKPIAAKALMYLQCEYKKDQNQNQYVTHKMKLFISFPSQTVGTAARIIAPVSNMIIDKNFHEVSLFLHMMTRSMTDHPEWVEQLAGKLDGVLDVRKQQLMQLTSKVYQENKKLRISQTRGQVTPVAGRKRTSTLR